MRRVMDKEADDPVAHDAAWLRVHSLKGQKIINSLPKYESVLRKLWAEAFHAGARHESITVNLRYLADVQVGHPRRTVLPARARAARMEKRDVAQYKIALQEAGGIRKKLFSILGMSGQGVRDFEKRHPELKKTK